MKKYWLMKSDKGKVEIIPKGTSKNIYYFSLLGFFPIGLVIWFMYRKLWKLALLWLLPVCVFCLPIIPLEVKVIEETYSCMAYSWKWCAPFFALETILINMLFIFVVISQAFIFCIIPSRKGNKWTMLNRFKNGYIELGEINAETDIQAITYAQNETKSGVHLIN